MTISRTLIGYLLVLCATVIWSGNFIVARALSDSIPPVTLAFLRWATAVIFVLPFGILPVYREFHAVRKNIVYLSVTALLGVTIFNTLVYLAAHTTKALNLSLMAICSPVFIILFARIFLKDRFTLRRILGSFTATVGILLLLTNGEFDRLMGLTFFIGDAWMLLAAAIFAGYSILARMKPTGLSPIVFVTSTFVLGLLFLLPWFLWEFSGVRHLSLSFKALAAVAYLGVGPSLAAFLCWNQALTIIGPVRAGLVYYCLPLFSGLAALLLLNEPVTAVHAVSGGLILSGVIIATYEK